MVLYFAYGSNLKRKQLEERVQRGLGPARHAMLRDHRLAFDKRGNNGTAKANVMPEPGAVVWGVRYEWETSATDEPDAAEDVHGGHDRQIGGEVEREHGTRTDAAVYIAGDAFVQDGLSPAPEYSGRVLDGAREHDLPTVYVAALEAAAKTSRDR